MSLSFARSIYATTPSSISATTPSIGGEIVVCAHDPSCQRQRHSQRQYNTSKPQTLNPIVFESVNERLRVQSLNDHSQLPYFLYDTLLYLYSGAPSLPSGRLSLLSPSLVWLLSLCPSLELRSPLPHFIQPKQDPNPHMNRGACHQMMQRNVRCVASKLMAARRRSCARHQGNAPLH